MSVFAYFIDKLRRSGSPQASRWQAVLAISTIATIYTLFSIIFTLFLGGNALFGNLAILLDIIFIGMFMYVAYATRDGSKGCKGYVYTPLGAGDANNHVGLNVDSSNGEACRLNTLVFALAILLCFLFLASALWQAMMVRNKKRAATHHDQHHQKHHHHDKHHETTTV